MLEFYCRELHIRETLQSQHLKHVLNLGAHLYQVLWFTVRRHVKDLHVLNAHHQVAVVEVPEGTGLKVLADLLSGDTGILGYGDARILIPGGFAKYADVEGAGWQTDTDRRLELHFGGHAAGDDL